MEKKEKKPLSAAQGLQAAHILFELNTGAEEILRMAQRSGLPEVFWGGPLAPNLCEEWRAFVHAVVTAGLMQHAPNSVLVAYLRDTGSLLEQAEGHSDAAPHADRLEDFVDGPFSAYMPLLAHERQKECPLLFFRRLHPGEELLCGMHRKLSHSLRPRRRSLHLSSLHAHTLQAQELQRLRR